ncbi:TatD family hydrolase [Porticoccus sp. W117]|uniref:TatD family hydrolase n=1 Tax=Porticoccus sp. W117 TaxID=3054777 RepID=UPI002596D702|nr:TatD family hydrolase [Porticoccus sp. W117]MDM3872268.1 TatD family hydrolase [Porticoccus sp. W117]
MLVDSHCHLDHLKCDHYAGGLDELLASARNCGVQQFLSVAVNLDSAQTIQKLAEQHDDIVTSVGVHPLQQDLPPLPQVSELTELARHPKVVAIGETGLDNHYSSETADWQLESFKRHLQAASDVGKPVIVHTREARQQTLQCIEQYGGKAGGVLHCFTETEDMARSAIDMGYYISFSGIITFRNATELRDVVKALPLERMLVETDSPWLAPVPYRGKQNEPRYVVEVARCVAEIKGVSEEAVIRQTGENFQKLFCTSSS